MRILHSYCLNYNIGDYALGFGLKNLLRKYLKVDLIGDTNIQGREFNEYYINEVVNKRYDLLVIGGGGIIHGKHWPNGWFWLIDKELIKTIKIPFIVYGVGYNYWEEEGGIPERGIIHLKETIKYARHFSVRNDGSAGRILKQTGIEAPVVPDPGFHVDINTEYERREKAPYVLIQVANDKPLSRFGSEEAIKSFVKAMRTVTQKLAKDYKVIFAPHVLADVALSKEIADGISNASVWDFGRYAFDHADQAVAFYKYAEFAIAMRGHGQIVPICFNTPVIALENHPKHGGLMKELNLVAYNVKVNDEDFTNTLLATISKLEAKHEQLRENYKIINQSLLEVTDDAFKKIVNIVK
ncbi:Polysaccharide pyruvyl transferase family protein WcaK [Parapedobacter composti]|uniref:Polysaccharide pyruvyl transferase family protein WcaK n=1 Tax=Parapedobacter composti TaxID=623281 RepID=A0A1I1IWW6_9SPHI|nr:polysaccharide pyruvyl transferase family protein [Parapedobacter composti]SFC38828.1 Polysaccharide pyruvyl transferase family protein WcaK [Parapedobacter composti]